MDKKLLIVLGIIIIAHILLRYLDKIDNFSNIGEKLTSIIWDSKEKELSPSEVNKLKVLPEYKDETEFSNFNNENRDNYNSAHLELDRNESEYTTYSKGDEFAGVSYN